MGYAHRASNAKRSRLPENVECQLNGSSLCWEVTENNQESGGGGGSWTIRGVDGQRKLLIPGTATKAKNGPIARLYYTFIVRKYSRSGFCRHQTLATVFHRFVGLDRETRTTSSDTARHRFAPSKLWLSLVRVLEHGVCRRLYTIARKTLKLFLAHRLHFGCC